MKKQIKRMLCVVLATLMVCFSCVSVMAVDNAEKGEVEVVTTVTSKGSTAKVGISFNVNPGIAGAKLKIEYDRDVLTLTGVEDKGLLGSNAHNQDYTKYPYVLYWENGTATENFTSTGVVVVLFFAVADGAANGEYPVTVTYESDNTLNIDGTPVEFNLVNGAVVVTDAVSEFTYIDMALDTDIAVSYYADVFPAHEGAQVRFTLGGSDPILVDGVPTGNGNEYMFTLNKIAPQRMTENIKAELVLGDEVLDTAKDNSIRQYCLNTLAKSAETLGISATKKAALDTLIADILEYGAAAQLYKGYNTGNLANEGVTGASEYVELDDSVAHYAEESKHDTVKLTGMGVKFDYTNAVFVTFNAPSMTASNFRVRFIAYDMSTGEQKSDILTYNIDDCSLVSSENSTYRLEFDPVKLTQYGNEYYEIELQVKSGMAWSTKQTLTMNVCSYIYALQNQQSGGSLTPMAKLARALYNYGASATAYAEA